MSESRCKSILNILLIVIYFLEEFFNDAQDNFLNELKDFNSRDDFDKFMSTVEGNYFENVVEVSKDPYAQNALP